MWVRNLMTGVLIAAAACAQGNRLWVYVNDPPGSTKFPWGILELDPGLAISPLTPDPSYPKYPRWRFTLPAPQPGPISVSSDGSITVTQSGAGAILAVDPAVVATQAGQNALLNTGNKYAGMTLVPCANAPAGTVDGLLAKDDGSGKCVVAASTDTGILGVVYSGGGKAGTALIQTGGIASCLAESGITAGHYVIPGAGGRCASSANPSAGVERLGRWITSGAGGTTQSYRIRIETNTVSQTVRGVTCVPGMLAISLADGTCVPIGVVQPDGTLNLNAKTMQVDGHDFPFGVVMAANPPNFAGAGGVYAYDPTGAVNPMALILPKP